MGYESDQPAIVGGPLVLRKRIANAILIGIPATGSILTIPWVWINGISAIEITSFVIFYVIVGLGVSLGMHRYFSHKSFVARPSLAVLLAAAASMAFQGSIYRWVLDHRRHHSHADRLGDVHSPVLNHAGFPMSPMRGLYHSHIGWMFDNTVTNERIYGRGICKDVIVRFFTRTYWFWCIFSILLPFMYGYFLGNFTTAIGSMLVGGFLRTTILQNVVWAVNSFGHTYGTQNYPKGDRSKNNLLLALLTFGDGWHNNHHKNPRSYRHGEGSAQWDINGWIIDRLVQTGLAIRVK
jgi:stearoyl-CoA desaturase (delta-9 desaturase)